MSLSNKYTTQFKKKREVKRTSRHGDFVQYNQHEVHMDIEE
jgi:chloramphenicol 3-O-phosphotransferase